MDEKNYAAWEAAELNRIVLSLPSHLTYPIAKCRYHRSIAMGIEAFEGLFMPMLQ